MRELKMDDGRKDDSESGRTCLTERVDEIPFGLDLKPGLDTPRWRVFHYCVFRVENPSPLATLNIRCQLYLFCIQSVLEL